MSIEVGMSFTINGCFHQPVVMIVEKISNGIAYCKSADLKWKGQWRVESIEREIAKDTGKQA